VDRSSTIGTRLKHARELKQLSQGELATKTGVSKGTISMTERDITELTTSNLIAICKTLGVSAEYVLFGDTMERHDEWKLLTSTEEGLALRQSVLNLNKQEKFKDFFVTLLGLRDDQVDVMLNQAKFFASQNQK
jgi:transcriptional regulator with XRE-family HTH domain